LAWHPADFLFLSFVFIDILGSFVRKVEKSRSSGVEEPTAASRAAGMLRSHLTFLNFSTPQLLNSFTLQLFDTSTARLFVISFEPGGKDPGLLPNSI